VAATCACLLGALPAAGRAYPQGVNAFDLQGGVDENFQIWLNYPNGQPVGTLPAGTYVIRVSDGSTSHNFHLQGADVDRSTMVGEIVTVDWTVTFTPGDYLYVCDPHAESMRGNFVVASAASSSPVSASAASSASGRHAPTHLPGAARRGQVSQSRADGRPPRRLLGRPRALRALCEAPWTRSQASPQSRHPGPARDPGEPGRQPRATLVGTL
jgi:hypothetical protein